ncbi:MAG TPA: M14 family zinc carboxypeptidase [Thermoguttaceae bacterium]|nr:M14 family zinc carboxypeptidase [Thermoguttaceae bacterium]
MPRRICKIWLGTAILLGLGGSLKRSAAEEAWSYDAWKPGGERVALDGITFDSTIPCGAGHDFVRVADDHYRFRSRIDHAPYAWRFYFKIECPEAVGRTITLEVADFDHAGRTPFHESATVYSLDDERWVTLGTENVAIVPWTPTGRAADDEKYGDASHVPYGVRYRLKLTRPVMWFASPTPYTLDRRDQLLDGLAKAHPDLVEPTTIGHSFHSKTHGYPLRMARITAPGHASRRQSVFLVAGEHCSETAGIYACEGWMAEVLEHPDWLERFVFYFVPIVNVDGVYYGATYYNLAPRLADGIGENVSTNWPRRTLPETQALWSVLDRVRPVFFASLHNGRHRRTMEAYGPAGPATDALVAAWRAELGLAFEGVRSHGKSNRAWGVLDEAGITRRAYTIETLLLCRQDGFDTFQASYTETGRQLARGTVTALAALASGAEKPTPAESKPGVALRFAGDDFTAKLPWFYHGLPFEKPQDHDVVSFEVNALTLPPGEYTVALTPKVAGPELLVGFDGRTFEPVPVREGRAELTGVPIRNWMLSLYVKARGSDEGGPLESVLVYPADTPFAVASRVAKPFEEYRRQIRTEEREILGRDHWGEFYALLRREGLSKKRLRAMFDQIVEWCKRRQVLDPENVHYGAIYSEEDKYDFRDAAAAAVCFTYAWRDSGDEEFRRRALLAREYVYKGQNMDDPANKERYGGFVQMVHGAWGPGMQRLGGPLTPISGVETCIIINLLVKTFELGLEPSPTDVVRLEAAAAWVANSEFQRGIFRHHEGATHDCQNSNALGAMALARAYDALDKLGQSPPHEWLKAARRGLTHFLEGQEAIGCWPYTFATIGRGQAFREQNVPDQGMGTYHFLVACQTPAFRRLPGVEEAAKRAARWWLAMSRIDREDPSPTIDIDDRLARGTLKFSRFTWCRFTAAASLMRIAELSDEQEPWRRLALAYMEHVGTKRWNTTDPDKAPVQRASPGEMTLCSWIQAAEWDGVLLREVEERMP